jgi:hypothetical protein
VSLSVKFCFSAGSSESCRRAAELDCGRAVGVFLRRYVVKPVGVEIVLLVVAFGVVKADRPEAVDWHVFDGEPVDCLAVVLRRHVAAAGSSPGAAFGSRNFAGSSPVRPTECREEQAA